MTAKQIKQQQIPDDIDALDLEALDVSGQIYLFQQGEHFSGAEWAYSEEEARQMAEKYGEQTTVKQPTRGGRS